MAGDGECTLRAIISSSNGDQDVTGPLLPLTGVASASVDKVLAWTKDVPTEDHFFVGDCNPALRS